MARYFGGYNDRFRDDRSYRGEKGKYKDEGVFDAKKKEEKDEYRWRDKYDDGYKFRENLFIKNGNRCGFCNDDVYHYNKDVEVVKRKDAAEDKWKYKKGEDLYDHNERFRGFDKFDKYDDFGYDKSGRYDDYKLACPGCFDHYGGRGREWGDYGFWY
jgi:hypothetical protein